MAEEFERIVREFQDKIFRLAYSMLLDRAAAEETTQDVLLRVWKGLPGFRAESSLSTWIYSITRNACLTARGRGAIHAVSLDEPAPFAKWKGARRPPGQARRSLDAGALLSRLPAKYRQVVALFYMQEKSYGEVASMLGLPVGTVKTYLFRARKGLAEELARERVRKGGT